MATIDKLEKPVVAFKVLAAGRLPAKQAFAEVFQHLKPKDGLCVGMCPKNDPDQIGENAGLTRRLTVAA